MTGKYSKKAGMFKALADTNRLMIVDMLSCGELCACNILEQLNITQPTLSHHMKILCDSGLVSARKEGRWMHYSLSDNAVKEYVSFVREITTASDYCICSGKVDAKVGA